MPRMKNQLSGLVADLGRRIDEIVSAARAQGRDEALGHIRSLVAGGPLPVKRGPGRPRKSESMGMPAAKRKKRRKNPWAGLSPSARLARVNAIRKGKGLPPRSE